MNWSPNNEEGLLGLVAALKQGMDPGTAYSIYQNLQQDQASQIARRQERLGGLADLLTGAATQGMPYAGAQALAEVQPGPAGPAVQNMLSTLYPTGETPAPALGVGGRVLDVGSAGTPPGTTYVPQPGLAANNYVPTTGAGPQATSPTFQPPQPSVGEQVQAQQLQQQQELQLAYAQFTNDAQNYVRQGKSQEQFIMDAAKAYPELFSDPTTVQQIIATIFGGTQVQ